MTVSEFKKYLENLEKNGKGDLTISVTDEYGFVFEADVFQEFDGTLVVSSEAL